MTQTIDTLRESLDYEERLRNNYPVDSTGPAVAFIDGRLSALRFAVRLLAQHEGS